MLIAHYSFGTIEINGKTYTKDVIIFPDRVLSPWWRKEGHLLQMEDLVEILKERPEVLVIGKGYSGEMAVPEELVRKLTSHGIQVIVQYSSEAVNTFNNLNSNKKIAALHLTC
jgi:hypothetical protein